MNELLAPTFKKGKRHVFRKSDSYVKIQQEVSDSITKDIDFHLRYFTTDQFDLVIAKNTEKDWLLPMHNDTFALTGFVMNSVGWVAEFTSIDGMKTIPVYVDNLSIDNKILLLTIIEEVL